MMELNFRQAISATSQKMLKVIINSATFRYFLMMFFNDIQGTSKVLKHI